ncbi:hypothetical protein, partial [Eubacterium aggregans]|uniref:hypothetical protein n=1 Tax=Eubacterium aggregans TaxID=81409 RepID=UPI003F3FCE6E
MQLERLVLFDLLENLFVNLQNINLFSFQQFPKGLHNLIRVIHHYIGTRELFYTPIALAASNGGQPMD